MNFQNSTALENKYLKYWNKQGAAVLEGIALYLNLDPNYFEEYVQHGDSILRPFIIHPSGGTF